MVESQDYEEWTREAKEDDKLQGIIHDLLIGAGHHPGFQLQWDKLLYNGKLLLPRHSSKIPLLLSNLHGSAHAGFFRTYKKDGKFGVLVWHENRYKTVC